MNFLYFGRFLAGCAREKPSNCVSPMSLIVSEKLLAKHQVSSIHSRYKAWTT